MGGPMMPPNVSMMPNAGGQGGQQGMYDAGPSMMGMQPDQYNGTGQYGPPRMANHYNPAQPSTSGAGNQYDNR